VAGCVHKVAKPDMSFEPKMTCSKIFIFPLILEFQKHFHYAKANAVKLSTFQPPHNLRDNFFSLLM
jgi:hypothetical protein